MTGGFRRLVHPATRVSDVDLEATRPDRQRLHDEVRTRDHLLWLLAATSPGDDAMRITPYEVQEIPEDEPASIAELFDLATCGPGVSA